MILRVWRSELRPGTEPEVLERLRPAVPRMRAAGLPLDFTYGFRHERGRTHLLSISTWPDIDSLLVATGGDLGESIRHADLDDLLASAEAETFEHLPPAADRIDDGEGHVIGVVTGSVVPGHESIVQSMVDRSAEAALRAGGLGAHVGRRMVGEVTNIAVIVIWPRRDTLVRFVRSRDVPAVDPAFTAHLSDWRFETYNALFPERLLVPTEGRAVLIVDAEGRYVEVTPGVESVLGIPGELLYGRSLLELAEDEHARRELRRRFLETGVSHGIVTVLRPDGRRTRLRYRSVADVPAPGLRASVLTNPAEPDDVRPTAEIVAEALAAEPPQPAPLIRTVEQPA